AFQKIAWSDETGDRRTEESAPDAKQHWREDDHLEVAPGTRASRRKQDGDSCSHGARNPEDDRQSDNSLGIRGVLRAIVAGLFECLGIRLDEFGRLAEESQRGSFPYSSPSSPITRALKQAAISAIFSMIGGSGLFTTIRPFQ